MTNSASIIPGASLLQWHRRTCLSSVSVQLAFSREGWVTAWKGKTQGAAFASSCYWKLCLGNRYVPLSWRDPCLAASNNSPLPSLPSKQTRKLPVLVVVGDQALPVLYPGAVAAGMAPPWASRTDWSDWKKQQVHLIKMKKLHLLSFFCIYVYFLLMTPSLSLSWKLAFSMREILWTHSAPFHCSL